jgi:hypothetical protein
MLGIKVAVCSCKSYRRFFTFVNALLIFFVIVLPNQALAFKADAHVWVAQQVLNDLSDGQLTFYIDGRAVNISVDIDVKDALLSHPETFRMGSIGPDALPGIYSGQVAIHGGSPSGGWGSGEWLEYIMDKAESAEERAFAYGVLTHAASDIFSHTYANTYTGGAFKLKDSETVIETRRFLLESYISSHLPTLLDEKGGQLGSPISLVEKDGELAIPYSFLQRTFIENEIAAEQFRVNSVPHLWGVNQQRETLKEFLGENSVINEFEDIANASVAYYKAELLLIDYELGNLDNISSEIQHVADGNVVKAQQLYTELRDFTNRVLAVNNEAVEEVSEEVRVVFTELQRLQDNKKSIEAEITLALNNLTDQINVCELGCDLSCPTVPVSSVCTRKFFGIKLPYPCTVYEEDATCVSERSACQANIEACPATILALEGIVEEKRVLENKVLIDIAHHLDQLQAAMILVADTVEKALLAEREATVSLIELGQQHSEDGAMVRLVVSSWIDEIDVAMAAYFRANVLTIYNSHTDGDVQQPLDDWVNCNFPALLGVPSHVNTLNCAHKDVIDELESAVSDLENFVANIDSLSVDFAQLKKRFFEKINNAVSVEVYQFANKALGLEVKELIQHLAFIPTAEELDIYFAKDDSQKGLVVYEAGISKRIDADMFLQDNQFDPNQYAVIVNAVTLSKLSLLKAAQLKQLVRYTGITDTTLVDENLMFRFASNIDGNHHWLDEPPPYLRREGIPVVDVKLQSGLGRTGYGYSAGPQLWNDIELRNSLFRKLFIGPLVPGIEVVTSDLSNKLPQDYPYQVIPDCSFPSRLDSAIEDVCPHPSYMDTDGDGLINGIDDDDDNDGVIDRRDRFPLDPLRSTLDANGISGGGAIILIDLLTMLVLLIITRKRIVQINYPQQADGVLIVGRDKR